MIMLKDDLQQILDMSVDRKEAAGISALVKYRDEEPLYVSAGYADIEAGKPICRDSIFRLYSQTKPVTSAAVMLLMQRGIIDLNDPVSKYLPGFAGQLVADGSRLVPTVRNVTLYDLLSMTAGLSYPDADIPGQYAAKVFDDNQRAMDAGKDGLDTVAFANELGRQPLAFQPGREFRYSTCADVLGAVVEVASGKPFAEFLRSEFFRPLGMNDTDFYVPANKYERMVTAYRRTQDGLVPWTGTHLDCGRYDRMPAFVSGGAGLVSTLDDYMRFAQMLLNGGTFAGHEYLSPVTVAYMTSPQLTDAQSITYWDSLTGFSYGKLMRIAVRPGQGKSFMCEGEYGWDGWLGTYFANFPNEKLTILLMQNTTDTGTSAAARKLRNVVLSHLC